MNTTDIKDTDIQIREGEDMLELIWERQSELVQKYLIIEVGKRMTSDCPVDLDSWDGQAVLKDMAWRVTEELGEAMNCLKNKPWKQTHVQTDREHFLEEISDALHFLLELCMLAGIGSAKELFMLYFKKSEVNKFRQGSGY